MATDLALPAGNAPSNLHLPDTATAALVESDMYNICERVKEISSNIHIWLLTDDAQYAYAVTEHCEDGVERLIFKIKELDARVLTRLKYLFSVPLVKRIELIDKENHRFERQERENQSDDLYERLGRPMLTQLEHDGFIQRNRSYPKLGVAGRSKRAR